MSEMVERVTEAINAADRTSENWLENMARAAIEAMREPTEAAAGAGAWALTILYAAGRVEMEDRDLGLSVIRCIWDAMINECFEPGTSAAWSDNSDETLEKIAKQAMIAND